MSNAGVHARGLKRMCNTRWQGYCHVSLSQCLLEHDTLLVARCFCLGSKAGTGVCGSLTKHIGCLQVAVVYCESVQLVLNDHWVCTHMTLCSHFAQLCCRSLSLNSLYSIICRPKDMQLARRLRGDRVGCQNWDPSPMPNNDHVKNGVLVTFLLYKMDMLQ